MLETGNMAIGLSAGGAWRVSGQRACPAAHGIACREVAQRSMHFDRHVARSNVECPSGPTADAPAHQPLTNDHGAGWPLCRGQGVSGTRDTSRAAWVVRWVVGAVSLNRRRASGGFRNDEKLQARVEVAEALEQRVLARGRCLSRLSCLCFHRSAAALLKYLFTSRYFDGLCSCACCVNGVSEREKHGL